MMTPDRKAVFALLGRTLLLLPIMLALWYFAAPFLDDVAGRVAKPLITGSSGGKVTDYGFKNRHIQYQVTLIAPYRMGERRPPPAVADLEVNASIYTFGLALFLALSFAHKATRRPFAIILGTFLLVVIPGWGVGFDVLKQLASTQALAGYLEWPAWGKEGIAVGYQIGALLLPSLMPVALWLGLSGEILEPAAPQPPSVAGA